MYKRQAYTHKRLLQTAHPALRLVDPSRDEVADRAKEALYQWICGKAHDQARLPGLVRAHLDAMRAGASEDELVRLATEHGLPWEALPTAAMRSPKLWAALLPGMGLTALVRNLGRMTAIGTLQPLSADVKMAVARLSDAKVIRSSRLHPFAVLQALAVYRSGRGVRGDLSWRPVPAIVDALDRAFYTAFANVAPAGKRTLIALDVSGSMGARMNDSPLSVREAGAALALVTARTEPEHHIVGFSAGLPGAWVSTRIGRHGWHAACRDGDGIAPLPIGTGTRLDDAVRAISEVPFGATDCALPMLYATARKLDVDVFVVITDNETWAGPCLLYTSPSPRDRTRSRMPSSA